MSNIYMAFIKTFHKQRSIPRPLARHLITVTTAPTRCQYQKYLLHLFQPDLALFMRSIISKQKILCKIHLYDYMHRGVTLFLHFTVVETRAFELCNLS